jgi:flagellar biogenesis protein FliO
VSARLAGAVGALTFAVSVLTAPLAIADEPAPPAPAGTPLVVRPSHPMELQPEPSSSRLGFKIAAGLVVLGGGLWAWKRRRGAPAARPRSLTIAARRSIGVRSELLIVEIDGHSLLLGVTPGSIQRLAVLPDAASAAAAEDLDGADLDAEPGFAVPRAAHSIFAEVREADRGERERDRDRERERDRDRDREARVRAADREPESRQMLRADSTPSRRPEPIPPRARVSTPPRKDAAQMERQIRGLLRAGRSS